MSVPHHHFPTCTRSPVPHTVALVLTSKLWAGHGWRAREGRRLIVETFLRLVASPRPWLLPIPLAQSRAQILAPPPRSVSCPDLGSSPSLSHVPRSWLLPLAQSRAQILAPPPRSVSCPDLGSSPSLSRVPRSWLLPLAQTRAQIFAPPPRSVSCPDVHSLSTMYRFRSSALLQVNVVNSSLRFNCRK